VPPEVRKRLRQGEWHLVDGPRREFRPVRYDTHRLTQPGALTVGNSSARQPLRFRLQAVPGLAQPGDGSNIVLLRADSPLELPPPQPNSPMPGAMAASVDLTQLAGGTGGTGGAVGAGAGVQKAASGKPVSLVKHRGLAVRLRVEQPLPAAGPSAALNVQLEASNKTYRDHYIDLDFTGEKVVILPEPTTERMLPEFRPAHANYAFKAAMYSNFHYQNISALNFRWMRTTQPLPRCTILSVEALAESDSRLENPTITCGNQKIIIPAILNTGDIADCSQPRMIKLFDRNWNLQKTVTAEPADGAPQLAPGDNQLHLEWTGRGAAKLTIITLGDEALPIDGAN